MYWKGCSCFRSVTSSHPGRTTSKVGLDTAVFFFKKNNTKTTRLPMITVFIVHNVQIDLPAIRLLIVRLEIIWERKAMPDRLTDKLFCSGDMVYLKNNIKD